MCSITHMEAIILPYTVNTAVLRRCRGTTQWGLRLTLGVDNEAGLAWLEDALAYAHSRPELRAYLEAVIDDVLFEMELEARS